MELVLKRQRILKWLRYLGFLFGAVMYWVMYMSLGETAAIILGVLAGVSFFAICDHGRKTILFDHIAEQLKEEIARLGRMECVIEIKMIRIGLIIRVYLIKAGDQTARYSKAIVDAISRSWYKQHVWITQVVSVDSEEEIKQAEKNLNKDIIAEIEKRNK